HWALLSVRLRWQRPPQRKLIRGARISPTATAAPIAGLRPTNSAWPQSGAAAASARKTTGTSPPPPRRRRGIVNAVIVHITRPDRTDAKQEMSMRTSLFALALFAATATLG